MHIRMCVISCDDCYRPLYMCIKRLYIHKCLKNKSPIALQPYKNKNLLFLCVYFPYLALHISDLQLCVHILAG